MIATVFLGTPAAAIPSLRALASFADVRLVVTRPDRPRGRSGKARPSAIKKAALDAELPVETPDGARRLEAALNRAGPIDVGVVVAFGMILPPGILRLPRRGFVNVHFSLLPRWRGAAPVERAILAGDERTGVTLMMMDEGLDTGPVIATAATDIGTGEDAGFLTERLAGMGAGLLEQHLADYVDGILTPVEQTDAGMTYAHRLRKEESIVSASWTSADLLRAIRALSPRPGARFGGGDLKVWKAGPAHRPPAPPGRLELEGNRLFLGTADHPIELLEVQAPGGKRMSGAEWARGRRGELGTLP